MHNLKYSKEILMIIGIVLFLIHIPFDHSFKRADIFLFYDYPGEGRYIANILKETGMYFIALIFVFLLWFETKNKFYLCFLIWWAYNIATYFLFYGQGTSIIGLPLLLILIIVTNAKNKKYN
jgi:hypothetical protein